MTRISVTFDQDMYKQLQESAIQKQLSVTKCIRDLINIGLRVEEAAKQNNFKDLNKNQVVDNDLKLLWENNLIWLLETLHLVRYLTRHLIQDSNLQLDGNNQKYVKEIIEKAKEKAQLYVYGLMHNKV